jgi:transcriptional regulator with XRE-family HTH domain
MDDRSGKRSSIRRAFARDVREARRRLRLTQQQVADRVSVSRGYVAAIERAYGNPTLDVVERITDALELEASIVVRQPVVIEGHQQRDLVHGVCSGYVARRLHALGWQTARELEVIQGRSHGWIDLLAFHPATRTLLVVEIKTALLDLGLAERQLAWYGRAAGEVARRQGWYPRRIVSWLLVLSSEEVEVVLRHNSELLRQSFPSRAPDMLDWLALGQHQVVGRGLALIDPSSKRRDWLIRSRIDGRRSSSRYANYAAAARRLAC